MYLKDKKKKDARKKEKNERRKAKGKKNDNSFISEEKTIV
jgi:hypothetical protein